MNILQSIKSLFVRSKKPDHTFTIDRKSWVRGEGISFSSLLRTDGKRCCLGFFCSSLGIPDEELLERGQPSRLRDEVQQKFGLTSSWLFDGRTTAGFQHPSEESYQLVRYNDTPIDMMTPWCSITKTSVHIASEEIRERLIQESFGKHNIEVLFTN